MGGQLIIISGCAGSGKSYIGSKLAKKLGWVFLDSDTLTAHLCNGKDKQWYADHVRGKEYRILLQTALAQLNNGLNVVLSASFIHIIRDYNLWLKMLDEYEIPRDVLLNVKWVWLSHDEDIEHMRLKARCSARDVDDLLHWEGYCSSVKGIEPDTEYDALEINIGREFILEDLIWKLGVGGTEEKGNCENKFQGYLSKEDELYWRGYHVAVNKLVGGLSGMGVECNSRMTLEEILEEVKKKWD